MTLLGLSSSIAMEMRPTPEPEDMLAWAELPLENGAEGGGGGGGGTFTTLES